MYMFVYIPYLLFLQIPQDSKHILHTFLLCISQQQHLWGQLGWEIVTGPEPVG